MYTFPDSTLFLYLSISHTHTHNQFFPSLSNTRTLSVCAISRVYVCFQAALYYLHLLSSVIFFVFHRAILPSIQALLDHPASQNPEFVTARLPFKILIFQGAPTARVVERIFYSLSVSLFVDVCVCL